MITQKQMSPQGRVRPQGHLLNLLGVPSGDMDVPLSEDAALSKNKVRWATKNYIEATQRVAQRYLAPSQHSVEDVGQHVLDTNPLGGHCQ